METERIITDVLTGTFSVPFSALSWAYPLVAMLLIVLVTVACTSIFRYAIMPVVQHITKATEAKWDDYLFDRRVMLAFRRIIPPTIWYAMLPTALPSNPLLLSLLLKACSIYLVVVSLMFISTFLRSLYDVSVEHRKLRNRPLKGIYQMFNLVAIIVGCILIASILLGKSAGSVLAGLGASAAIIMLIFRDTILGLVAGVQLTANDMLRPGDWITMNKYGANGFVKEVSLTTVKVQNFDKTITTIPPYLLVSDSFQNWRGMRETGGRRLKMSIFIDATSLHFCTADELSRYVAKGYISKEQYAGSTRPVANMRVFRDFMLRFFKEHPDVKKELMMMVRTLQPTTTGIPVELYCFTRFLEWAPFERFQSEVLDYALIMAAEFGLTVFQSPSGDDLRTLH